MRTAILTLSLGMAVALLGCGLFGTEQNVVESGGGATPAAPERPSGVVAPLSVSYDGPSSLESRILKSPVIARVRLRSATSTVESVTIFDGSTKYIALLEFSFSVLEYLKGAPPTGSVGSGVGDIMAVWESRPLFDTRQEAEAALPAIVAGRDTQWDEHEAIVFLQHSQTYLISTQQAGRYYLSWKHEIDVSDDSYSIASRHDKLWLPAVAAVGASSQPSGDQQRFLLDTPPATGTPPTITLGEMKARIAAVAAKLDAGDDSAEYRECVRRTYYYEGKDRHRVETRGTGFHPAAPDIELDSGLATSTVAYQDTGYGDLPNKRGMVWLDGGDADLFSIQFGDSVPWDSSRDGVNDSIYYARRLSSSRPLPSGAYRFRFNNRPYYFVPCDGYTFRYEWTVTVTAPAGTLHEAFFDPVTDGSTVAADSTNGVVKPAGFTDSNGASATIQRVAWEAGTGESGTVKLKLRPHNGIAGHTLHFIALDGSVPLSLKVADATVDAPNDTLSWTVASQPWDDGDKLMLRIRETPDCSQGAVANPSANPDLVTDCEALLELKNTLRGTATLNWNATSTISTWDGVTTGGTPSRVTRLELANEGLDGSIPGDLGRLSGLTHLDLSRNSLTGEIPGGLGSLSNLAVLRLSGNSLSGCIPLALMSVATNDLSSLDLPYCRPPAPGHLSAGTAGETSIPLSWNTVPNTNRYRVEYRTATSAEWTVDIDNATSTSHTVDELACGTDYRFRVSAHGSGTVYEAEWSEPSGAIPGATSECRTPTFGASSYSFGVREDAATTTLVGTVSATDPNDDALTYTITAGNGDGRFGIGPTSGAITVAAALDYETTPSYTLTVEASDGDGNSDTATVDIAVTDVFDDISPAPGNVDVSLSAGTFTITWDALTGAGSYEAQYRTGGSGGTWTSVGTTATTMLTYSPTDGPECGTTYEFRVRAYGDGTTYVADWGQPSEPDPYTTEACNRPPEFTTSTYLFMVAEDATTTDSVGTVLATDPDSDPVSHSITTGNAAGKFEMSTSTGAITVAGALDHETVPSYTLTVEAGDGRGGVATTTVRITVTDVPEDAPPAPGGLSVSLTDDAFGVTWSAVTGAAFYEVQQQVSGSADGWALVATTTGLSATYSPVDGAECGTTYEFRVRTYGDGTTYVADWGEPSQPEPYMTDVCNRVPRFGASSYTLTIPENAGTSTSVGAISATDPDGDTVTYSITAGNDDGKFAIATSTGAITLTGTVDPDVVAFYALTVAAGDGVAGTSTAAVGVAVLLDECSNGTVVPRPRSNPRLVRDCSMLLAARDALAGDASLDWSADTRINDWQGLRVERGDSPYVRVLLLTGMGLTGRIPPEIGGIADLRRLDLDDNMLTGQIPRELGSLSDMVLMYLHINRLTGAIPAELGALANLQTLNLSDNMLTGGIPAELGNLRNLRELLIEENSLTGGIPAELGALSNLWSLYLNENMLTEGIPAELGKLSNLTHLLLERNSLGGEIPPQLGDLTRLKVVYLRHNGLTGAIPAAWGELANLTYLYLSSGNNFTGCIPSGLRDVADNDLAGLGLDYCSAP